jgi:hypothetical protein
MSIGIYALVRVLMTVGPRLGYQNQRLASLGIVNLILDGMQLTTTAVALSVPIDLPFVLCLSISVLFIFLANYMGNYVVTSGQAFAHSGRLPGKTYHKNYFIGIDRNGIFINPALLAFTA